MKISLIFNIILCVFVILYIGEFEMTTKPFRVSLIHWDRALGLIFIAIGVILLCASSYRLGLESGIDKVLDYITNKPEK